MADNSTIYKDLIVGPLTITQANGKWVMGDLKKDSFMTIWHNDKFKELRKAHLKKDVVGTLCETCAMVG